MSKTPSPTDIELDLVIPKIQYSFDIHKLWKNLKDTLTLFLYQFSQITFLLKFRPTWKIEMSIVYINILYLSCQGKQCICGQSVATIKFFKSMRSEAIGASCRPHCKTADGDRPIFPPKEGRSRSRVARLILGCCKAP